MEQLRMADTFCIIMPAYNEGRVVAKVVSRTKSRFPSARLVVVNDGSTDNTAGEAARGGAEVITLPFNCGYGVALQTGLICAYRANAFPVVTMDADGQHEPDEINRLMEPVLSGQADVALGSRYLIGSKCYRVALARRIASFFMAKLLSLLSRQALTDSTTGFQCLSKKAVGLLVELQDFPEKAPDADVLLYLAISGCRVREVPVIMHADAGGESMHGPIKSLLYLPQICTSLLGVMLGRVLSEKD